MTSKQSKAWSDERHLRNTMILPSRRWLWAAVLGCGDGAGGQAQVKMERTRIRVQGDNRIVEYLRRRAYKETYTRVAPMVHDVRRSYKTYISQNGRCNPGSENGARTVTKLRINQIWVRVRFFMRVGRMKLETRSAGRSREPDGMGRAGWRGVPAVPVGHLMRHSGLDGYGVRTAQT